MINYLCNKLNDVLLILPVEHFDIIHIKYIPASAFFTLVISVPSNDAASRCRSGHATPVNSNTAGADITTESPCGMIG